MLECTGILSGSWSSHNVRTDPLFKCSLFTHYQKWVTWKIMCNDSILYAKNFEKGDYYVILRFSLDITFQL